MATSNLTVTLKDLADDPAVLALVDQVAALRPGDESAKVVVSQSGTTLTILKGREDVAGMVRWARENRVDLSGVQVAAMTADDPSEVPDTDNVIDLDLPTAKPAKPFDVASFKLKPAPDRMGEFAKQIASSIKAAIPATSGGQQPVVHAPRPNQAPWSNTERKPASEKSERQPLASYKMKSPDNSSLCSTVKMKSPEHSAERSHVSMRDVSMKIVQHEHRHANILRDSGADPHAKPRLTEARDSRGQRHVVAGEVETSLKPVRGNPRATEAKAESVYRSALSDAHRSPEDNEAARRAQFTAQEARQKRMSVKMQDVSDGGRAEHRRTSPVSIQRREPLGMQSPESSTALATVRRQPANHASSGHGVTMRNPFIIAGAAIARGAVAVGQTVVRGAAATGRAARSVLGYASRTPTSRAGQFFARKGPSGGVVETRAEMLARGFRKLEDSSVSLEHSFSGLSDRLKSFSPEIAIQNAFNNINRIAQNFEQARRLGKPLAEFEKQQGRIEIAENALQGNLAELMLPIKTAISKFAADILEWAASSTRYMIDLKDGLFKRIDEWYLWTIDNMPFMKDIMGDVRKIREDAQRKALEDQKQMAISNVNDFFGMQSVPANAQPKINGPVMAMPIMGFNPANP